MYHEISHFTIIQFNSSGSLRNALVNSSGSLKSMKNESIMELATQISSIIIL